MLQRILMAAGTSALALLTPVGTHRGLFASSAQSFHVESDPAGASAYVDGGTAITLRVRLTERAAQAASATPAGLRVVVIEGEDAVNIIQQKTAVAPVVEVRDRNNQPVAGVLVRFAINGGRATFSGARALTVTTNAAGRAVVTGLTPTSSGAFQITASATFQGQTAAVTIAQTNVMTAAQAAGASAGASTGASGGGGGFPTGIVAAVGGAAVGGLVLRDQLVPEFRGCGGGGGGSAVVIVDVTEVFRFGECEGGETVFFNFGDGSPETSDGRHVYRSVGTFQVTEVARKGDKAYPLDTYTITVTTLTGRWRVASTGAIFDLVQTGNRVTGTYALPTGGGTGSVSGTLQHGRNPLLQATLSGPPPGTLTANTTFDPNSMSVVVTGSGFPPLPFSAFDRQ